MPIVCVARERAQFAVFHTHFDDIRGGGAAMFFDFVAGITTSTGTGDSGQCAAVTGTYLMAQDATQQCTGDNAHAAGLRGMLNCADGFNLTAVAAARSNCGGNWRILRRLQRGGSLWMAQFEQGCWL